MIDFETLRLTGRPNAWLAAPDTLCREAKPHAPAPFFEAIAPGKAFEALRAAIEASPRMRIVAADQDAWRLEATDRTAFFGFVDDISARALAAPGGSSLAIYSRSRVGHSDFGVNRKRVFALIAAVRERLG